MPTLRTLWSWQKYCLNHWARTCCSLRNVTRCRFTNWWIRCERGGRNVQFLSINLISFCRSHGTVLVKLRVFRSWPNPHRHRHHWQSASSLVRCRWLARLVSVWKAPARWHYGAIRVAPTQWRCGSNSTTAFGVYTMPSMLFTVPQEEWQVPLPSDLGQSLNSFKQWKFLNVNSFDLLHTTHPLEVQPRLFDRELYKTTTQISTTLHLLGTYQLLLTLINLLIIKAYFHWLVITGQQ